MKKWLVYLLGIVTGIVLTFGFIFCLGFFESSGIRGLELFDEPGEYMDYSQFEVFQVITAGCALATADNSLGEVVFIIPDENQAFYDDQEIILQPNQRAQRVGTYRYESKAEIEKTVPAVRIVNDAPSTVSNVSKTNNGITLFDKPGDCVSRKNFEIQEVLESGDAIAREITDSFSGIVMTSDLEVLMLATDGKTFYNNQIVKVPGGKCAVQIGT